MKGFYLTCVHKKLDPIAFSIVCYLENTLLERLVGLFPATGSGRLFLIGNVVRNTSFWRNLVESLARSTRTSSPFLHREYFSLGFYKDYYGLARTSLRRDEPAPTYGANLPRRWEDSHRRVATQLAKTGSYPSIPLAKDITGW